MKSRKKYNNLKYFFVSMIVSEIFLMLFLGLIIAEHNIRYIILGSKDSFLFFDSLFNIFSSDTMRRVLFITDDKDDTENCHLKTNRCVGDSYRDGHCQ